MIPTAAEPALCGERGNNFVHSRLGLITVTKQTKGGEYSTQYNIQTLPKVRVLDVLHGPLSHSKSNRQTSVDGLLPSEPASTVTDAS